MKIKIEKMASAKHFKWLSELNTATNTPFEWNKSLKSFWCKSCEKAINADQKEQLKQHKKSQKHQANSSLKRPLVQTPLEFKDPKAKRQCTREEEVGQELCDALLSANIPIHKMNNPKFRGFLEKNVKITFPSVTTLREKHVPQSFENAIEMIRKDLEGKKLWMSIDETTDATGKKVANVILGELSSDTYCKPYLANCAFLEAADAAHIARLANDTLNFLWPGFDKDLLKLMVSDAARYMVKAGKDLKIFYPSLVHVTCLCHGLHRVCEIIRESFSSVNNLIATGKKIFVKAPSRVQIFRESNPNLPLPPTPVVTR